MSEPLLETANFQEILVQALKRAKEYVYHVENLCTDEDLKQKIVKWVPASAEDARLVKNEIDRVYKLCLDKAQGKGRSTEEPSRIIPTELIAHLQSLVSNRWRFLSPRKLRDETSGRVYLIHGWDSTPVGPSRIASKVGLGSKGVDAWIFLGNNFSPKALETFGSRPDVAMISLSNNVISGGLASDDALLHELVMASKSYSQSPERFRRSTLDNSGGVFRVRESARVFRDQFEISDCGHLHLALHDLQGLYSRRQPTVEEKLERPGMLYLASSTDDDPKEILSQMENYRDYLLKRLDELSSSESVVTVVKRDLAGNLATGEVRFLCKTCGKEFSEIYEFPEDPPVRGLQLAFRVFVARVAQELQANAKFIEIYEIGVIKTEDGNLIIMMHPATQPAANVTVFNPRLTVVVCNFFRDRWRKPALTLIDPLRDRWWREGVEGNHWMGPRRMQDDPKASAFAAVSSYLVPSLSFDCLTESHEYMEVTSTPAELEGIVQRIQLITLTVKPTEKAFKAAHDRLLEEFRAMGLFFGYDTQVEYRVGPDRLDVAWVNRLTQSVDVAIEVELGNNPTGELWKLVELQPMLAVLAVKGNQYDQTLSRIAKSKILRNLAQTLMVLDVSEKRSVLVRGNDILRTEDSTAPPISTNPTS